MGYKFLVFAYLPNKITRDFRYQLVYEGNSRIKAFLIAANSKRRAGCVKIEWR